MAIILAGLNGLYFLRWAQEPPKSAVRYDVVPPQPDQVSFYERPMTLTAVRKSNLPRPVIVLLEKDPWAQVIGSDSPSFALYDDGSLIQRTATGFSTTRLTNREMEQLLQRLKPETLSRFYGGFEATFSTDQPDQDLLIYRGEKPVFVSVYGSLEDREVRSKIPKEVVAAYDTLSGFKHAKSRPWLPENVEVMIAPYEYAPDASISWPQDWPGLSDSKTVKRGEDSFSIYMPSAKLAELRAFLERRKAKGAVEIDGRKWSVSIRYPFPHERLWMVPHPELGSTKR